MKWCLGGRRRFRGRLAVLLVLLGAPGCFRVNTPRAARATLPADAEPRQEYKSRLGNPAFYDEFGVRYRVLQTSKDYVQRGIASWYGQPFHGRTTSTGETYDMYAMTAAHKTLPLPTYVRVTDLDTGNRVVVRVNDRGTVRGGPRHRPLLHRGRKARNRRQGDRARRGARAGPARRGSAADGVGRWRDSRAGSVKGFAPAGSVKGFTGSGRS